MLAGLGEQIGEVAYAPEEIGVLDHESGHVLIQGGLKGLDIGLSLFLGNGF
jgi:hypothetical protein